MSLTEDQIMRSRSCLFLLTLVFTLLAGKASAQPWTLLNTWDSHIEVVHFNYKFTPPTVGFVGLSNGEIWRTNTAGASWTKAIMNPTTDQRITCFTFKNANIGWATCMNNTGGSVYMTTDGGIQWNLITTSPNQGNGIYYNAPTNRLFFASTLNDFSVSVDDGTNWASVAGNFQNTTGIAFSDGMFGIATRDGGNSLLRTTDGGQTWATVAFTNDSWQPLGVGGTSTFFVSTISGTVGVHRSTDGGATWTLQGTLPATETNPTGDIKGDRCNLFAQGLNGLYISKDQGKTWAIQGTLPPPAPGNVTNTRFSLGPNGIYAGEVAGLQGKLWEDDFTLPKIGLNFPQKNYSVGASACNPADTFIVVRACECDPSITLQSVEFTGQGASKYSVPSSFSFPAEVCDSTAIPISYTSATDSYDTSLVIFHFQNNETIPQKLDTYTNFFGHVDPLGLAPSNPKVSLKVPETCIVWDTTLVLKFNACDPVTITNLRIDDSSNFRIDRDFMQYSTGPQGTLQIHVFANPTQSGLRSATITVDFVAGAITQTLTIPLQVNALKAVRPVIQGFTMNVPNGCALRDTMVTIQNTQCDTLKITTLDFFGDTSAFSFEKPALPLLVPPGEKVTLNFRSKKVYKRGTIFANLRYAWTGSGEDILQQIPLNTIIQNDLPLTVQSAPGNFAFGNVSLCGSKAIWMKLTNTLCSDIEIIDVQLTSGPSEFTLGHVPTFPRKLVTGAKDSILVDFVPTVGGSKTGTVTVTLRRDGVTQTVSYNVTGNAVTTANAEVSEPLLTYDTTNICSPIDSFETRTTYIRNESCDSVQVTQFSNTNGDDFALVEPALPFWIHKGDSVQVKVILRPKKGGDASGEFDIRLAPKGGAEVSLKLTTQGFVRPAVRNIAFTAPSINILDSLKSCQSKDTSITLTNNGLCDTMVINDIVTNGSGAFSILNKPANFPVRLAPGESITITLHIDPGTNNPPVLDGNLTFVSNPDTAIPLHVLAQICATNTQRLSLDNPDTVFNAERCKKLTRTFTVQSIGSGQATIDQITLTSAGQSTHWKLVSPTSFPVNVPAGQSTTIVVEYDPDGSGDQTAQLTITSAGASYSRTLSLSGNDNALHPTVKLGLRLADNQKATRVNITEPVTLSVVGVDQIDGTLGVTSVALTLNYNGDVLNLPSVTAMNGWTLGNNTVGNNSLNLVFNHAAGAIPANTEIAQVKFTTILSDSTNSIVWMDQTQFNKDDPNFDRCIASAVSAEDTLNIAVDIHCTDSVLLRQLRGDQFNVGNLIIRPNPMGGGATNSGGVSFDLLRDAHVKIDLIDPVGRLANTVLDKDLVKGHHNVPLTVQKNSQGWYLLTITSEGVQMTKKILLEK